MVTAQKYCPQTILRAMKSVLFITVNFSLPFQAWVLNFKIEKMNMKALWIVSNSLLKLKQVSDELLVLKWDTVHNIQQNS